MKIKHIPKYRVGNEVTYEIEEGWAHTGKITEMHYEEKEQRWSYFVPEAAGSGSGQWLIEEEILQLLINNSIHTYTRNEVEELIESSGLSKTNKNAIIIRLLLDIRDLLSK